jgi:hypothetical protein
MIHRQPQNRICHGLPALFALLFCAALPAQQTSPEDQAVATTTLHVYVNLIQVPVLILDPWRQPRSPVPPSRFRVSLSGQTPFSPRHVRREGDDPIALALLIDASDPHASLWKQLSKSLGLLVDKLRPEDTVQVYALDGCALRRFGNASAPDADMLQRLVSQATAIRPYAELRKELGPCVNGTNLWTAMDFITRQLETRSSRRVLLAISNGQRSAGEQAMLNLGKLMDRESVSVFGIADSDTLMSSPGYGSRGDVSAADEAGMLARACEVSGGIVLPSSRYSLAKTLAKSIELVRGRYIVEFPRPPGLQAGSYGLQVSIGDRYAFIRPGGASAPIADPKEAHDPTLEQGAPSQTP